MASQEETRPQKQEQHPDADIYPSATGAAKATVDSHQDEQDLKLYAGWFCPFVQRVWTVLEEKQIPYQYIEVNPYHKPESLLKLNPRGLVPTLEFQGKPIYESTVIVELLEDAFPDHGPSLRPADVYERARLRIWSDFVTSRLIPSFHRFLQFQPQTRGEGVQDEGLDQKRQEFLGHLKEFVREMHPDGPFFNGDKPQLVDFVVAPWALRLWVFDEFKQGSGIPSKGQWGPDEKIWKRWHAWYDAMSSRDSLVKTTSETKHYMPLYQRYAEDKAQSEMAKAIRAGKGVP